MTLREEKMRRLTDEEYRRAYSLVPRVCVDLLIRCEDKVLLIPRLEKPEIGSWHLPGGRVRLRETVKEAALSIARRELGVDVVVGECLGYLEFLRDVGDLGDFHSISVVLAATLKEAPRTSLAAWFSVAPEPMLATHSAFLIQHGLLKSRE